MDGGGGLFYLSSSGMPENQLFDSMLGEYPAWLKEARAKGLIV